MDTSIRPKTREDRDGERFRILFGAIMKEELGEPLTNIEQNLKNKLMDTNVMSLDVLRDTIDAILDHQT